MNRVARVCIVVTLLSAAAHPFGCTPLEPGTDQFAASGGNASGATSAFGGTPSTGGSSSGGTVGGSGESSGGSGARSGSAAIGGSAGAADTEGGAGAGGEAGCPPEGERDEMRFPPAPGELEIDESTTWTCEHDYLLNGTVVVAEDATLSISAGTRVRAAPGALLLVMRRGRLEVLGTADEPVVFTSANPEGERAPGDWRGIVLIGDAPSHAANVQVYNTLNDHRADYGGGPSGSPGGSCGIVRYARIEFAGGNLDEVATPGAALTFAGCGAGTEVHHVQVHRPTDGIGILGGTLSLTEVLVTNNSRGDSIEWSAGFTGTLQFVIVQSLGGAVGVLGSNSDTDPERVPVSAPRIFNATLVGSPPPVIGSHFGFLLQFGSLATLKNSIVYTFDDAAFDLRLSNELLTTGLGPGKPVDVSNILMYGNRTSYSTDATGLAAMTSMRVANPGLDAATMRIAPSFVPTDNQVFIEPAPAVPPFDTTAAYRGAMPVGGADWTAGWTDFPER